MQTTSLPTSVYETGNVSDRSPDHHSPATSPSPAHPREAWTDALSDTNDDLTHTPPSGGTGATLEPPYIGAEVHTTGTRR